ncbi:unnamed protein product [Trichogramma brassicae]|uniref:CCHC-type domain-containing protein n=1 Tax=Trichogramma brassicae TaxID=86971 RepID=A0A6H5J0A7_9HYME|nr:unnamed protein product [Trichogramma brassicae]
MQSYQRTPMLRMCRGYATTSTAALQVVCGVLPLDLEVLLRYYKYKVRKKQPFEYEGIVYNVDQNNNKVIKDLQKKILDKWQIRWQTSDKGRHTYKYFPDVGRRKMNTWFKADHYTSQFITSHGDFSAKLRKFGLCETPECNCGEEETADHILFECEEHENSRKELKDHIRSISKPWPPPHEVLVSSLEIYDRFSDACRRILKTKEERRRRTGVCSIASSISDAGSESKKRKVIHEDRTEVESEVAKHESCATLKIEQLEDETLVGLEKLRVKHKFTGSITDYVKQQLHAMKRIALELAIENTRLAAKNEYLSDLVDKRLSPSYSSVAARGAGASGSCPQFVSLTPKAKPKSLNSPSPSVGRKKGKVKKSFVAVVSSSTEEEPGASSDVLMSVLKSTIDPVGDGIHVRSVNKSRSGRLFVETASKQDLEKLISNAGLKARGVSVTLKERRLPRMIIYDVPVAHSGPELSELLRKQNPVLSPQHVLKPIFKVGKRDNEVTHWVMDVSPECRDVLVKEGGLYLGWRRCRVKEHCALTRCFKCQEFSHIAKYCKEKEKHVW